MRENTAKTSCQFLRLLKSKTGRFQDAAEQGTESLKVAPRIAHNTLSMVRLAAVNTVCVEVVRGVALLSTVYNLLTLRSGYTQTRSLSHLISST
jgi:hypothetical protein